MFGFKKEFLKEKNKRVCFPTSQISFLHLNRLYFRALDLENDQIVALKCVSTDDSFDMLNDVLRETDILKKVLFSGNILFCNVSFD